MHSQILTGRLRRGSLNAVPPPKSSSEYSQDLADLAAQIFFPSPVPSKEGYPIYILSANAFPDSKEVDFDELLPYVLAILPNGDELIDGQGYEVVFFAGGGGEGANAPKKSRPGWGWFLQAYKTLDRATRKRLRKLYIVHERSWVRILIEMFSTVVSPKFRKKIYHVSTMTHLASHIPIENLLIPTSAYLQDRQYSSSIHAPYVSGRRAFCAVAPFPISSSGLDRLPRVLRETTRFLLLPPNIETEGLFRIPPSAKLLDILQEAYNRAQRFIVWREGQIILPQPVHEPVIKDVRLRDGYSPQLAAALIKLWYRDLRSPLIPSSAYKELKSLFGEFSDAIDPARLIDVLSLDSKWSCLPYVSRQILIRHLLPLLHAVSEHSDVNKMSSSNLAICFAPALVCSEDPVRDAGMGFPVRKILDVAVEQWDKGLREVLGTTSAAFQADLLDPDDASNFEDPLKGPEGSLTTRSSFSDSATQLTGIEDSPQTATAFSGNDDGSRDRASRPPLPPRRQRPSPHSASSAETSTSLRRRPAPQVTVPPRYSTTFPLSEAPRYSAIMSNSPTTQATTTDGFRPSIHDDQPPSVNEAKNTETGATPVTRKPLTTGQIDSINTGLAPLVLGNQTAGEAASTRSDQGQNAENSGQTASRRK